MSMQQVRRIERIVLDQTVPVAERRTAVEVVMAKLTKSEELGMAEFYLEGLEMEGDFTEEELDEVRD